MTALASSLKDDLDKIFTALDTDPRPDETAIELLFELEERVSAIVYDVRIPGVQEAVGEFVRFYTIYALGLVLADEISEAHFLLTSRLPDVVKSENPNCGINIIIQLVEALQEGDYRAVYGIHSDEWPDKSYERRLFDRFLDKWRRDMLDQIIGAYARIPREKLYEYLGVSSDEHLNSLLTQEFSKGTIGLDPTDNNYFICKKDKVNQPLKPPLSISQQSDLTVDLQ